MASNRQDPVPSQVDADVTRPVDVSGTNTRPLPRTPPPPRNPDPPPASRLTTRERLEAAASRFMDALPDGVGIPDDDDDEDAAGPVPELTVDIELDQDDTATQRYQPVDAQIVDDDSSPVSLGVPSDDDSATFAANFARAAARGEAREQGVMTSAKSPAAAAPASPAPGPTKRSSTAIFTGPVGGPPRPPSMSSLGMAASRAESSPASQSQAAAAPEPIDAPADTEEIDLDDSGVMELPSEPASRQAEAAEHPATPNKAAPTPAAAAAPDVQSTPMAKATTPTASPAPSGVQAPAEMAPETPRKSRAGLWLGLAALALLGGGAVGAWQMGLLDPYLGDAADGQQIAEAGERADDAASDPAVTPPDDGDGDGDGDGAVEGEAATEAAATSDTTALPNGEADGDIGEAGDTDDASDDAGELTGDTDGDADPDASPEALPDPIPAVDAAIDPSKVPTPSLTGDGSLAAAKAALAKDPAKAYELAHAVNDDERSDAALEIMALAGCAADDGKLAREAFKQLRVREARKHVTSYCETHTEINVRARSNDYLSSELMRMGERAYVRGDYDEALELVQKAQKKRFQRGAGQLLVAIYCAQGNETKARYMLRRMPEKNRDVPLAQCKAKGVVIEDLDEI